MRSILWNGFELKKSTISTESGDVPYLCYIPAISKEPVNIAIHGEGHEKEAWLCFNSALKHGNLLKESIKMNSPFIAFDLYGHGEWHPEEHEFNPGYMSDAHRAKMIDRSISGIEDAIHKILKKENLQDNPVTVTSFSLGCTVNLGLQLNKKEFKSVLISPFKAVVTSDCADYLVIRGEEDELIDNDEFYQLYDMLPGNKSIRTYSSKHDIPMGWINRVKEYIY